MQFFLTRLREPSTYAGIAALVAAFGIALPDGLVGYIAQAGIGLAGIAAVFLGEKK